VQTTNSWQAKRQKFRKTTKSNNRDILPTLLFWHMLWQFIQLTAYMWCTAAITSYRRKSAWCLQPLPKQVANLCFFLKSMFWFVGMFGNWKKKPPISFVISACLSTGNNSIHTKADFHEIWYWVIFRKSVEKIQVSLKSGTSKEHFTWRPMFNVHLRSGLFLEWKVFQKKKW